MGEIGLDLRLTMVISYIMAEHSLIAMYGVFQLCLSCGESQAIEAWSMVADAQAIAEEAGFGFKRHSIR